MCAVFFLPCPEGLESRAVAVGVGQDAQHAPCFREGGLSRNQPEPPAEAFDRSFHVVVSGAEHKVFPAGSGNGARQCVKVDAWHVEDVGKQVQHKGLCGMNRAFPAEGFASTSEMREGRGRPSPVRCSSRQMEASP